MRRLLPEWEEEIVYRILLGIGLALAAAFALCAVFQMHPMRYFPACVFRGITGLYCPGCGIGHAVEALLAFQPLRAFLCHPFLVYVAVILTVYILANAVGRVFAHRRFIFPIRGVYLWIGLALLLGNWILRNVLWLGWRIPIY